MEPVPLLWYVLLQIRNQFRIIRGTEVDEATLRRSKESGGEGDEDEREELHLDSDAD